MAPPAAGMAVATRRTSGAADANGTAAPTQNGYHHSNSAPDTLSERKHVTAASMQFPAFSDAALPERQACLASRRRTELWQSSILVAIPQAVADAKAALKEQKAALRAEKARQAELADPDWPPNKTVGHSLLILPSSTPLPQRQRSLAIPEQSALMQDMFDVHSACARHLESDSRPSRWR